MNRASIAALCLAVALAAPAHANSTGAPPLVQSWSDTGLLAADDDWSRVPAIVGYRGDGLVGEPGVDPRTVLADGSATPVDVNANRTDPRAVGLAAGITEFELADPVVAIQGSATASAPQLVVALDTRLHAGISVRLALRDIDASGANAVEAVALQYRVGASGSFANAPGGYVADATTGPGAASAVTRMTALLPAAANNQPLVQVRVLTTNAAGQDEWVGVDDIDITATSTGCAAPPPSGPGPGPGGPGPGGPGAPGPGGPGGPDGPGGPGGPGPVPRPEGAPALTDLRLAPADFAAARRGPAIVRGGTAGAALSFRLSRPASVRFTVEALPVATDRATTDRVLRRVRATGGRFAVRGKRGVNRMRFTGRVRGRALADGDYVLTAAAIGRGGGGSAPGLARFRIGPVD
ncbi:MAG TPA: hypothetical protein VGO83_06510 [Thermoleophilaceae bacterium]|nr:hypothetical protein [Thermoleophilaceae bacterium]